MPIASNYDEVAEFIEELVIFQNRTESVFSEFIARPTGKDPLTQQDVPRRWSGNITGEQNCIAIISNTMGWFERCFKDPFKAGLYVVYSYGYHYPMFAYDLETDQWFINSSKYSPTTSKQSSMLRPKGVDMVELDAIWMKELVDTGSYRAMAQTRVEGEAA